MTLDYDCIGELVGVRGDTAKQYSQRDLDSLMTWINARRTAKGLPQIGLPADNASEAEAHTDDAPEVVAYMFARTQTGLLSYDPLAADFRVNGT